MNHESLFEEEPKLFTDEPGAPLAARMRPRTLDEMIGQRHLLGAGTLLRRSIEEDKLSSLLLQGPPGCGKSTLALVIARATQAHFENCSAISSGVADLRKLLDAARLRRGRGIKTVLFVDEIHRWNKAQQDALLPSVEDGTIILVGATTENPSFEVNGPLLSRMRLMRFEPLSEEDIHQLLVSAISDRERGLGNLEIIADEPALEYLAGMAAGDARRALTALEAASIALERVKPEERLLTLELAKEGAQQPAPRYDREGDNHYNTISAFIKSIRGSDQDAGLYWLAVMLEAGEDPVYIARRLVILASEDIGCADPMALVLANSAAQAVQFVGLPEGQLSLAQAVIYLAGAPKSNSATTAIAKARAEVREHGPQPIPFGLCDKRSVRGRAKPKGAEYKYPHDYPHHYVDQQYLPLSLERGVFYTPSSQPAEQRVKARLEAMRADAVSEE